MVLTWKPGFNPRDDGIIEIGAVKIKAEKL